MLFNEKLYKLRKEHHLSQEALAEKLHTTRQAISKWENGQGFPETEKLLELSNIFNVSVDYLLKDTQEGEASSEKGYYVSKEMAEGYLTNFSSSMKWFCFGGFLFILGAWMFLKFDNEGLAPHYMLVLFIAGALIMMRGLFLFDDKYSVLSKEILLFDSAYLTELRKIAKRKTRHLSALFGISFVLMMIAGSLLAIDIPPFTKDVSGGLPLYMEILICSLSITIPVMFYSGSMAQAYALLAENDRHTQSFTFKFSRKTRAKVGELLK